MFKKKVASGALLCALAVISLDPIISADNVMILVDIL